MFRHLWFPAALLIAGLYAGLPWLAPVFMHLSWTGAGRAIYDVYSTQCHQLAQRSYFLFGPRLMYSPGDLGAAPNDFSALRAFTGSTAPGWKLAWSDRMTAMYTGLFIFMIVTFGLRRRLKPLPVWAFALLLAPLALDGMAHFVSDLAGLGAGFRDSNLWLAALTANRLPIAFYAGDAWGSFNAWMRLLSGVLFWLGIAWFSVPRLASTFEEAPGRAGSNPGTSAASSPRLTRSERHGRPDRA